MEDHKELPSAVNPELRQKEVQMNFFNQLTSVFNPDLTTILASPTALHMQVSFQELSSPPCAHTTFSRLYHWMATIWGWQVEILLPSSLSVWSWATQLTPNCSQWGGHTLCGDNPPFMWEFVTEWMNYRPFVKQFPGAHKVCKCSLFTIYQFNTYFKPS